MSVLTIASVTFAPILAIILIKMDENNGLRIVNLTILVTFIAAIIGMYSGIDFSALGYILIAPLALLILWNFARIFYNFPDWQTRGMGFFGSLIFILFYPMTLIDYKKQLSLELITGKLHLRLVSLFILML